MDKSKITTSLYINEELLCLAKIKAVLTEHSFSKYVTILIKKDLQKNSMEEPFEGKEND